MTSVLHCGTFATIWGVARPIQDAKIDLFWFQTHKSTELGISRFQGAGKLWAVNAGFYHILLSRVEYCTCTVSKLGYEMFQDRPLGRVVDSHSLETAWIPIACDQFTGPPTRSTQMRHFHSRNNTSTISLRSNLLISYQFWLLRLLNRTHTVRCATNLLSGVRYVEL